VHSMTAGYARKMRHMATAATLTVAASAQALHAQSRDDAFSWSGTVATGRTVMIKNVNGPIRVERSTSNRVEVTAEKRWRRGNPDDVRIEQPRMGSGDVLICALFTPESTCDEMGIHTPRSRSYNNRNDVSVHFVVRVPDGIRVDVATVNGALDVSGVSAGVTANTVNGTIDARSTGGPVRAHTVNGSLNISMGSFSAADDLEYETVNGSVTLELPTDFGGQLELSTVNGRVSTDFPITITGTLSPRRLRGSIGNGGARIRASTVNGSVTLRRSN